MTQQPYRTAADAARVVPRNVYVVQYRYVAHGHPRDLIVLASTPELAHEAAKQVLHQRPDRDDLVFSKIELVRVIDVVAE